MANDKLSHLARALRRSNLPVRRHNETPPAQQEAPPPAAPAQYGKVPDSWAPRFRPENLEPTPAPPAPERRPVQVQAPLVETPVRRGPGRPKKVPEINDEFQYKQKEERPWRRVQDEKRRTTTMTISVSPEEQEIIRQFVQESHVSFSSWVREMIFRAMNKRVPKRGKKDLFP